MAHQSGYDGSLTMVAGPTALIAAGPLRRWTVNQVTDNHPAHGKGETWEDTFYLASEWSADVEANLPDGMAAATQGQMLTGQVVTTAAFKINAADSLTGSGFVDEMTLEDPLDGPVLARFRVEGDGQLVAAVA